MKKLILILAVAAFSFSPLLVSQVQAGQGKHSKHARHHHQHQHHGKHHKK